MLRFKYSVLFGTRSLLNKSLRVLKLPTHLSNLTANGYYWNSWVFSWGCKLIRAGWVIHFWLLDDSHFVWLDVISMPINNPINIFLINPNIILYYVFSLNIYVYLCFFIKYLCIFKMLLVSIGLESAEKSFTIRFNHVFLYY